MERTISKYDISLQFIIIYKNYNIVRCLSDNVNTQIKRLIIRHHL